MDQNCCCFLCVMYKRFYFRSMVFDLAACSSPLLLRFDTEWYCMLAQLNFSPTTGYLTDWNICYQSNILLCTASIHSEKFAWIPFHCSLLQCLLDYVLTPQSHLSFALLLQCHICDLTWREYFVENLYKIRKPTLTSWSLKEFFSVQFISFYMPLNEKS